MWVCCTSSLARKYGRESFDKAGLPAMSELAKLLKAAPLHITAYLSIKRLDMDFNLKKPCKDCPFTTSCLSGWLGEERAEEIANSITYQQQTFPCHKTTRGDAKKEEHCAGALILLEKIDRPNQMMRISERLGFYDRTKLDYESNVFDDTDDFIDHHI